MSVARIVFMGSPGFAVPSLVALCEQPELYKVVAVFTQPDKPAGRGRKLTPSAVSREASARGIRVLQPTKMKPPETRNMLAELAPDVVVVAAYGRILPPSLLELPPLGCVNVHASLLPRHRGASPIAHALLAGDEETGISIMQMDEGMDTGPVFARRSILVGPQDDSASLAVRLAHLGAVLLLETLPGVLGGTHHAEAQDSSQATYAPLLKKEDGLLDLTQSAVVLERKVRALYPWPVATLVSGAVRLQIRRARCVAQGQGQAGHVLGVHASGVTLACGEGGLLLEEVKPAGKNWMPAAAWAAGRGIRVGAQLV